MSEENIWDYLRNGAEDSATYLLEGNYIFDSPRYPG